MPRKAAITKTLEVDPGVLALHKSCDRPGHRRPEGRPVRQDRWGDQAAGAIWDASIVKIILGGTSAARDLELRAQRMAVERVVLRQ